MDALPTRPPRDTGPLEIRDYGPTGRKLGTVEDCYDGSPWELHRGELVEQMPCEAIHSITIPLFAALFRTHARDGLYVLALARRANRGDLGYPARATTPGVVHRARARAASPSPSPRRRSLRRLDTTTEHG